MFTLVRGVPLTVIPNNPPPDEADTQADATYVSAAPTVKVCDTLLPVPTSRYARLEPLCGLFIAIPAAPVKVQPAGPNSNPGFWSPEFPGFCGGTFVTLSIRIINPGS